MAGLVSACLTTWAAPALAEKAPDQPTTSVGGTIFTDYSVPTPGGPQSFNLTRAFLSGKTKIDKTWSGSITFTAVPETFATNVTGGKATLLTEPHTAVLQNAFLQADGLYPGGTLQLGIVSLPWLQYENGYWGYRMLGPTPMAGGLSRGTQFMTLSDHGFRASGVNGPLSYAVAVFNGLGSRALDTYGQKSFQGRVTLSPLSWLDLSAMGHRANLAGVYLSDRAALHAGLTLSGFKMALQNTWLWDQATVTSNAKTGQIVSAYGILGLPIPFVPPSEFLLRADLITPDVGDPNTNRVEAIAGIAFKPVPGVTFVLDDQNVTRNSSTTGVTNSNVVGIHSSLTF